MGRVVGIAAGRSTTWIPNFLDHKNVAFGGVFSSIDHNGRYAFGNQANIGQWNLARLAETLLPLFSDDKDESVAIATEVLMDFPKQYQALWDAGMSKKLGLKNAPTDLVNDLLQMLHTQSVDYTQFFRSLSSVINGDASAARNSFINIEQYDAWESRWKELISRESHHQPTLQRQ